MSGPANSTKPTSSETIGGVYNVVPPVLQDGQGCALQLDINGNLKVSGGSGGGTIGGSIAATQVAVGSGVNTIAGTNNFTWNAGTQALSILGVNNSFISMDASGNVKLQSGTFGAPALTLFNAGNTDFTSHGLVRVVGTGSEVFQIDSTTSILKATWFGQASGSASIGVAAAAGTPNPMLLPLTTGTSGQVLSTDGGTPNQQLSWATPSAGSASSLTLSPLNLLSTSGAIPAHTAATYVITDAGAAALTLAAPTSGTDDGKVIVVTSDTAVAHTITATGLFNSGVSAAVNLATFSAFAGATIILMAYQGKWNVFSLNGVTMS